MLIITLLIAFMVQGEVFDCVVTEKGGDEIVVVCDSRNLSMICTASNDPLCEHLTLGVPPRNWNEFAPWPKSVKKGELLKAQWVDGNFRAVASCVERTLKPPKPEGYNLTALNPALMPADCYGPRSEFIAGLQSKFK